MENRVPCPQILYVACMLAVLSSCATTSERPVERSVASQERSEKLGERSATTPAETEENLGGTEATQSGLSALEISLPEASPTRIAVPLPLPERPKDGGPELSLPTLSGRGDTATVVELPEPTEFPEGVRSPAVEEVREIEDAREIAQPARSDIEQQLDQPTDRSLQPVTPTERDVQEPRLRESTVAEESVPLSLPRVAIRPRGYERRVVPLDRRTTPTSFLLSQGNGESVDEAPQQELQQVPKQTVVIPEETEIPASEREEPHLERSRHAAPVQEEPHRVVETVPSPTRTQNETVITAGDRFEVRLPGRAWLYLGGDEGVEFLGRSIDEEEDETVFAFRSPRDSVLPFESQNHRDGSRLRHEEIISVVSPNDGERSVAKGIDTIDTPDGATGQDDSIPDTEELVEYIEDQNRQFDPELHRAVIDSVGEEAVTNVSETSWLTYADRVRDHGGATAALKLLQDLWDSETVYGDVFLFRLAQMYEIDQETRNVRKARELYGMLVEEYPFSEFYTASQERIRFLDRHFLYIR